MNLIGNGKNNIDVTTELGGDGRESCRCIHLAPKWILADDNYTGYSDRSLDFIRGVLIT